MTPLVGYISTKEIEPFGVVTLSLMGADARGYISTKEIEPFGWRTPDVMQLIRT